MKENKIIFNIIFLIFLILSGLLFSSFLVSIIVGAFLAYISRPLYNKLNFLKYKELKAITILIILIAIFFVVISVTSSILFETIQYSFDESQKELKGLENNCENDFLCTQLINANEISKEKNLIPELKLILKKNQKEILNSDLLLFLPNLLSKIPSLILQLFIMFFTVFYLLIHSKELKEHLIKILPLRRRESEDLFSNFNKLFKGVFYGFFITAIIQAILASIIYYIIGVQSYIFWGIMTGIAGIIPFFGTGLIWIPMLIYILVTGWGSLDYAYLTNALILGIGGLVISSIDNLIKPKVMSDFILINSYYIVISVFGGVLAFGVSGIILGPLIIIVTNNLMNIYKKRS